MADPLTDRINQLSLQSHRQEQKRRVDEAKTPKKRSGQQQQQQHDHQHDHQHDRHQNRNQNQNHPSQNSHRSLAALPSPGLRRIRERLGVPDLGEGGGDGPATLAAAEEARRAATAAARAAAQAEADAARAIDAILEQQEGLLAAMSAALALPGGGGAGEEAQQAGGSALPSASSMRSAVTAKIVECIEEATKAELLKLPGVAREGADIRGTAVYWIAMARFEESHDRAGGAGAYLREGVEHIEAGAGAGSSTQVGALRLALERLEAGAGAATGAGARTRPPRPLPAAGKEEEALEGAAAAPRKSPRRKGTAAAPESPALTPTRRSIRIQARSAEKEGAPRGRGEDGTVRGVSAGP